MEANQTHSLFFLCCWLWDNNLLNFSCNVKALSSCWQMWEQIHKNCQVTSEHSFYFLSACFFLLSYIIPPAPVHTPSVSTLEYRLEL